MPNFYVEAIVKHDGADDPDLETSLSSVSPYPTLSSTGGVLSLSAEVDAPSEREATSQLITAARHVGLTLERFVPDLVNIQEITHRTTASSETVRTWVRGERRADFPAHTFLVGTKFIWSWKDVLSWIKSHRDSRVQVDDLYDYEAISMEGIELANAQLREEAATPTYRVVSSRVDTKFRYQHSSSKTTPPIPTPTGLHA